MRKNPFKSKAQARLFFAKEARGELPKGTARKWMHETPNYDKLPEHVSGNPSPGLVIHMYYAEGSAYWLLGHLEQFASFERADRQLNEWSGTSHRQGAANFAIYIDGQLVYDGSYNLAVFPADLKRQVNLFLQDLDTEDAHILLAALAEQNPPKLEHGYVDPDTGAWMSKRRFETGADVKEMSEAIVEDPVTVDDINAALLSGTLGIGSGGLVTHASRTPIDTGEGEPEPARTWHRREIQQRQQRWRDEQAERIVREEAEHRERLTGQIRTSGDYELRNIASWALTGRPMNIINTPEDIQWLREVHLHDLTQIARSAIIYGNEDSPDRIEIYAIQHPTTAMMPFEIWVRREDEESDRPGLLQNELTDERLQQLSISHDLDLGGYEYERVRNEWVEPLARAGITHVAEIDADVWGSEVFGSANDFFDINIHSLDIPVILFTPSGTNATADLPWPTYLPGDRSNPHSWKLINKGYLNEYEHECICAQNEDVEDQDVENCNRCGGDRYIIHEGGEWALYAYTNEDIEGIERLNRDFGPHVGLNADWAVRAWHVGPGAEANRVSGDLYILEIEDQPGDYTLVRMVYEDQGAARDEVQEIFEGPLEDVMRAIDTPYLEEVRRREQEATDRRIPPYNVVTQDGPRRITTTYDVITPESARQGDVAESGISDEYDVDGERIDGTIQWVNDAAGFLNERKPLEPSSSWFHTGIWYTQADVETDRHGIERRESYHLKNFLPEEQAAIYKHATDIADKFSVKWNDGGNQQQVMHYDRRVQLYNNGKDFVIAILGLDRNSFAFTLFDGNANIIAHEERLQMNADIARHHSPESFTNIKDLIMGMMIDFFIEVGMNRDYIEMLGERIPFVEF